MPGNGFGISIHLKFVATDLSLAARENEPFKILAY